jgi:hypothetical protein
VNKRKIAVRSARLLYPTKLPQQASAIGAVKGHWRHFALWRTADDSAANPLTRDEAFLIAVNITKRAAADY